jgi:hypothetical protein
MLKASEIKDEQVLIPYYFNLESLSVAKQDGHLPFNKLTLEKLFGVSNHDQIAIVGASDNCLSPEIVSGDCLFVDLSVRTLRSYAKIHLVEYANRLMFRYIDYAEGLAQMRLYAHREDKCATIFIAEEEFESKAKIRGILLSSVALANTLPMGYKPTPNTLA